jgi:ABC-type transport system involved in cytochrome c biogenesis ATPase subunit
MLGLRGRSFGPCSANLTSGLWVVLADTDSIAAEFTRLLVGLDKPVRGKLLIDGHSPRRSPTIRANIASLLAHEDLSFTDTAQSAVATVANLHNLSQSPLSVLGLLGLEGLATRDTGALSSNESRQVATALALTQVDARAAAFCEPLLALNPNQIADFQQHLCVLASRACVVCVTSSLHDAKILGGPHAQLSRRGWLTFSGDSLNSTLLRVHVEGPDLRQLASELSLQCSVARLTLQTANNSHDVLELVGPPADLSTGKVVGIARRGLISISRMFMQGAGNPPVEALTRSDEADVEKEDESFADLGIRLRDFKLCTLRQLRLLTRAYTPLMGLAALLAEPTIATLYAKMSLSREESWGSYNGLIFLGTVMVPLWSLILCRLMCADSILGCGVETFARYGVGRRALAFNRLVAFSLLNGALAALSAGLVCASGGWVALAHGELISAMWITGLGGAVYGAIVVSLTDATRSHWVRWAFILFDFLLGGTSRAISFPFPRAHLHNLLGSATAIEFPQRGSSAILGLLLFLAIGLTIIRTEP